MIDYKKVLVLYVGGTIGMQRNQNGVYVPTPNAFLAKIQHSEMHDPQLASQLRIPLHHNELILPMVSSNTIVYTIEEYDPLLDSSNMSTNEWIRIAKDIEKNYDEFDGFVVLHGTDTLAFTSSVLSFMLENLQKPVVITGSQIPIFETRSDAKENFLSSLMFAGCYDIPEVCVFFASKLLRGNRTTKICSNLLSAFDSPNFHRLADAGIDVKIHQHYIRKTTKNQDLMVHTSLNSHVGTVAFFPTITSSQLDSFLKPPTQGVVLQSYGAGNIPSSRIDLLSVLKHAVDRGVIIVNVTQCSKGAVSIAYETGKVLEQIGIVPGCDMTSEAALTKLIYVLGLPVDYATRIQQSVWSNTHITHHRYKFIAIELRTPGRRSGLTNPDDIVILGRQTMAVIFGDNTTKFLAALPCQTFTKKVITAKSFVNPEHLPPTGYSTKFYCLRVYYQTMIWMNMASKMNPLNWGWKLDGDELVMCDMNVAPDTLLKIVHCNFTTNCSGKRCSCRKYGLPCSYVCETCQVTRCDTSNVELLENSDED